MAVRPGVGDRPSLGLCLLVGGGPEFWRALSALTVRLRAESSCGISSACHSVWVGTASFIHSFIHSALTSGGCWARELARRSPGLRGGLGGLRGARKSSHGGESHRSCWRQEGAPPPSLLLHLRLRLLLREGVTHSSLPCKRAGSWTRRGWGGRGGAGERRWVIAIIIPVISPDFTHQQVGPLHTAK